MMMATTPLLRSWPAPRPGRLADDPDLAVEADVVEAPLPGHPLPGVERGQAAEVLELGVAVGGVVVEGDLGVEGVDAAVGPEDQRVDLDEVGVERHEGPV